MNVAFGPITHVVRANVFENAATWRLGSDSLERLGGLGRMARLPRFDSARYRCDVLPGS